MPDFSENIRDHVIAGLIVTAIATVLGSIGGLALVWLNSGGVVSALGGVPRPVFDALEARVNAATTKRGTENSIYIPAPVRDGAEKKNHTL